MKKLFLGVAAIIVLTAASYPSPTFQNLTILGSLSAPSASIPNAAVSGLGTASTASTGTSGHNLGYLDGAKTDSGANSYSAKQTFAAATTSTASINLPPGTSPTSPANGDIWTTNSGVFVRIGGVTQGPLLSAATTGRVLLNTLNPSGVASVQDTTSITGAYTNYLVEYDQVLPATNNATFLMRVQQGGSFATSGYGGGVFVVTGTPSADSMTNATYGSLSGQISNSNSGTTGSFRFNNPASAGKTSFQGTMGGISGATGYAGTTYIVSPAGAITGLQFLFDAGNIASGTIRIYGLN